MAEKLTYRNWMELSFQERIEAEKRFVKGQNCWDCTFGYNSKGELIRILDHGVLRDIFSI